MATYYWVGGTGTWDATTTTNWSTSSGGAGGAGVPTAADDVIFNSASNATGYTLTVGPTPTTCKNCTMAAPASGILTWAGVGVWTILGSLSITGTNITKTYSGNINFTSTVAGNTIDQGGLSFSSNVFIFGLVNGTTASAVWTLASNFTSAGFTLNGGTFTTNNFNMAVTSWVSTGTATRAFNLGSSTINATSNVFSMASTGMTFNAGTSTINLNQSGSVSFTGAGLTYYNVAYTSAIGNGPLSITGANTFNNLTFANRSSAGVFQCVLPNGVTTTINGTLTCAVYTSGNENKRTFIYSDNPGVAATLSVATLGTLTNVDFRSITAAGASSATPWSGTSIGDYIGNTNITFTTPKTVYWVSSASANWNAAVWGTSSGTTGGSISNIPLAQDTVIFDNAGLVSGGTITIQDSFSLGRPNFTSRTNPITISTPSSTVNYVFGDVTLNSAVTLNSTSSTSIVFGDTSANTTFTSNGATLNVIIGIDNATRSLLLGDNTTLPNTKIFRIISGTLDLNGYVLSTGILQLYQPAPLPACSIAFGISHIDVTGNAGTVCDLVNATNFTYTGTPTVNLTYSGSTGTRSIAAGTGWTATNSVNFNITAGTDIIAGVTSATVNSINFTGFSGSYGGIASLVIYGNLTLSSSMTVTTIGAISFLATSGTQQLTTNNVTVACNLIQNSPGATLQLQDNLTSTGYYTFTSGTLDLNDKIFLTIGGFVSTALNTRVIKFGTGHITSRGVGSYAANISMSATFSYTGTPNIYLDNNTAIASTLGIINSTEANALNVYVISGTYVLTSLSTTVCKTLDFTGFSGTASSIATVYGSLILSSGMTYTPGTTVTTFASTTTGNTFNPAGKTFYSTVFNGVGGEWTLLDNYSTTTTTNSFTKGTVNFNGKTISVNSVSATTISGCTLNIGSSSFIVGTGANSFSAGAINITSGSVSGGVSGGAWNISGTASMTIDTGSFTCPTTLSFSSSNNISITSTGSISVGTTYAQSGSGTLDINAGSFTAGTTITQTGGTITVTTGSVTAPTFTSSTGTRTINMGSGTWNLTGTGTVWTLSAVNTPTFSRGTATINLTDTSTTAKTFAGGGYTYSTLNISATTGIATYTITGSNTFANISSNKTVASTLTFTTLTTTTVDGWYVSGSAGNLMTINSSATAVATIASSGGATQSMDYVSISNMAFTPISSATQPYVWYAGANSVNNGAVSSNATIGGNSGILFQPPTVKGYLLASGTSWTVPADWNSSNNAIHMIGAGGGSVGGAVSGNNRAASGGGGGGGYRVVTNVSLTPSTSISYAIGAGVSGAAGGNTTFNTTNIAGGGGGGTAATTPTSAGGAGGTGTFAGGAGGAGAFGTVASTGYGGGGGGGAGGPNGIGGAGGLGFGSTTAIAIAGGGGGGNGGGSAGGNASASLGGTGGNNFSGVGGGAGSATTTGNSGTLGGGGGGNAGATGNTSIGGSGIDILNTIGGAGGRGAFGTTATNWGLYGTGAAGSNVSTTGGVSVATVGGQGSILIVYTPTVAPANGNFFFMFG